MPRIKMCTGTAIQEKINYRYEQNCDRITSSPSSYELATQVCSLRGYGPFSGSEKLK